MPFDKLLLKFFLEVLNVDFEANCPLGVLIARGTGFRQSNLCFAHLTLGCSLNKHGRFWPHRGYAPKGPEQRGWAGGAPLLVLSHAASPRPRLGALGSAARRPSSPHVLFLQGATLLSFSMAATRCFSASSAFFLSSLASLYLHLGSCRWELSLVLPFAGTRSGWKVGAGALVMRTLGMTTPGRMLLLLSSCRGRRLAFRGAPGCCRDGRLALWAPSLETPPAWEFRIRSSVPSALSLSWACVSRAPGASRISCTASRLFPTHGGLSGHTVWQAMATAGL